VFYFIQNQFTKGSYTRACCYSVWRCKPDRVRGLHVTRLYVVGTKRNCAEDNDQMWAVVNTVMKLRVP